MAEHDQEQMSNATVAFMQAVAFAVAVHDTTMQGEMSAEEFLGTIRVRSGVGDQVEATGRGGIGCAGAASS